MCDMAVNEFPTLRWRVWGHRPNDAAQARAGMMLTKRDDASRCVPCSRMLDCSKSQHMGVVFLAYDWQGNTRVSHARSELQFDLPWFLAANKSPLPRLAGSSSAMGKIRGERTDASRTVARLHLAQRAFKTAQRATLCLFDRLGDG